MLQRVFSLAPKPQGVMCTSPCTEENIVADSLSSLLLTATDAGHTASGRKTVPMHSRMAAEDS
jgi:hypothetical protein